MYLNSSVSRTHCDGSTVGPVKIPNNRRAHGGSGTTHLGVKYGCASLIIPHIMDQHIWNDMNVKLGVGPKGISIGKLNLPDLTLLILAVYFTEKYKTRATVLSNQMNGENHQKQLLDFILA